MTLADPMKTRSTLVLLACLTLLSSCAHVLNQDTKDIEINYDSSISRLWVNGELHSGGKLRVRRSPRDLRILVETKDSSHDLLLEAYSSPAYWLNLFYTFGIGLWLEHDSKRRWTYPATTYLRYKDGKLEEWRNKPRSEGTVGLKFALPYGNWFNMQRPDRSLIWIRWSRIGSGVLS
jgi:hypothetical protein